MAIYSTDEVFDMAFKYVDSLEQSDDSIKMYNDLTNTRNDLKAHEKDTADWKEKYEQSEEKWHKRFKEQFYSGGNCNDTNQKFETEEEKAERLQKERLAKLTVDDLFKK
jgi:hypothetical protein